ncbi:MAG: tyrosine--tRNA ligase [Candidatus Ranarchaeia archaeon]
MSIENKIKLVTQHCEEVLNLKDLEKIFSQKKKPRAYIGFELSGLVHLGTGIIAGGKILDLLEAGCEVIVFLADWHSWINNKLGGNLEKIKVAGQYFINAFESLGIISEKYGDQIKYIWASELANDIKYWEKVVRIAKKSTISRILRTLPIMGRTSNQTELESAWIYYPAMQAADIFHMEIDIALGGMDQRKAHMLARDVADKLKWDKPIALHTPLLSGLKGQGKKMDEDQQSDLGKNIENKMSKSKPETCIFIHDSPDEIKDKINKAFCPFAVIENNPLIEICKYIIFPRVGKLEIERPEKFGGSVVFEKFDELVDSYTQKKLHPSDLKSGISKSLIDFLSPVREYFKKNPKSLKEVFSLSVSR